MDFLGQARRRYALSLHDPDPIKDSADIWGPTTQVAIVGIFVLMFIGFLYFCQALLVPIFAAVVVGATFAPLIRHAARLGIPRWVSALVVVIALFSVVGMLVTMMAAPVGDMIKRAPEIGAAVKEKLYVLDWPLAALRELQNTFTPPDPNTVKVGTGLGDILAPILAHLTPAASQFVLFAVTLIFILIGEQELRNFLVQMSSGREAKLRALRIVNDVSHNLVGYLTVASLINVALGAVVAAGTWLLGFPYPLLFGLLTAILNFIPYVGPAAVTLILLAVGLATSPSLGHALIAPVGFVAVATVEGQIIKPAIIGRRLTLSPLTVFLNLAFWTWLWGPIGTFLADPFSIIALVTFSHLFEPGDTKLPE